jgi:hypothetical protein
MSHCSIYFRSDDAELRHAEEALREGGLAVTADGDALVISWTFDGRPLSMRVTLEVGEAVRQAARALGNDPEYANLIPRLDARFVLRPSDLDAVLDEINTLIIAQHQLLDLTKGFQHTAWNDSFLHWRALT